MAFPVAIYLTSIMVSQLVLLLAPAALAGGPYRSKCDWSEWRCLDRPDGVGCVAQRSRLCCNSNQGCQLDSYVHKTLFSKDEQLANGIVCLRREILGPLSGASSTEHQDTDTVASGGMSDATYAATSATSCLIRPRFDGSKFPPPNWCPWTEWSSWTVECRAGVDRLPAGLVEFIQLGNESEAFKYSSRSRGCYCPASPDPAYICPGPRLDWRYKLLAYSSLSSAGDVVCHWCSWEPWQPACTCPLPDDFPKPRRRRTCLCVKGDALVQSDADVGILCGNDSNVQVAASAKSVCPACSHLHANYQVSQFLNPLAIGFAVYLLVALAAFLLCRLFCGNPRHSDANSRDQLSVDDFLASPPVEDAAATSAV